MPKNVTGEIEGQSKGEKMNGVTPEYLEGNGLSYSFSRRKPWTITCGKCGYIWRERVHMNEPSMAICPHCNVVNQWSIIKWYRAYHREMEQQDNPPPPKKSIEQESLDRLAEVLPDWSRWKYLPQQPHPGMSKRDQRRCIREWKKFYKQNEKEKK